MAVYRIYVDEVGNHDMHHADDPNQRFLSLTGVIMESDTISTVLYPEMEQIKREFFQQDPDDPVVFHRKEMVNKRWPFHALRDPELEERFNSSLLAALARWEYRVITVVVDKQAHRNHHQIWPLHPYHFCLAILLEQYVFFLHRGNHRGDVMIESRGGREDHQLKDSYARLYERGTDHVSRRRWQTCLTSHEIKIKPKTANISGLQLADLIAHPSRREVLLDYQLIADDRNTFGDQICAILRQSKYLRNSRTGRIEGYGKRLLP